MVEDHSDLSTQGKFTVAKECRLNRSHRMILPKDYCQEYPFEADPQDTTVETSPQATSRGTTEELAPEHGTEASSGTPNPFTI